MVRIRLTILLLFSAQFAFAQEWQETKSQEGNFKIQLPGASRYLAREVDTELGKIKVHMFVAEADMGNTAYVVMYSDYPDELFKKKTTDQILRDAADGAVEKVKGKLKSETRITYRNLPGSDLLATTTSNNQTTFITWRLLLKQKRLYQVGCVGVGKRVPEQTVKRINESFELLR